MLGNRATQSPRPRLQGLSLTLWAGEAGAGPPVLTMPSTASGPSLKLSIFPLSPSSKASGLLFGINGTQFPKPEGRESPLMPLSRTATEPATKSGQRCPWTTAPTTSCSPGPLPPQPLALDCSDGPFTLPPAPRSSQITKQPLSPEAEAGVEDVACGSHITIHDTVPLPMFPASLATLQSLPSSLCRFAHANLFLSLPCKNPPSIPHEVGKKCP